MFEGGAEEIGITPTVSRPGGAYDLAPKPKYFVEFAGGGHMAWTDVGLARREPIVAYSLAFLDHYIKGAPAAPILTHAMPEVADLRFDSELGDSGPPHE
jgi:hypothetical protein